jgi:predicted phage tail protein
MTRKLLPYEHELIQILKVSEDEYLEFLAVQHDFTRSREEKLQELRAEPISIILAVVGIILQAVSYLLAPKPEMEQKNQRQRRDQVFAPRFGFNSQQELAKYGDPVNLVYCNVDDNPTGGVRVASSLVWSAVHSEGSSQFMQMLVAIGASEIQRIAPPRIAFGQTPIRQLAAGKTWAYLGANRPLRFSDLIRGDESDPTRIGEAASSIAYRPTLIGDNHQDGFSQAFSPSTMTRFGVFAPIPINVVYIDRDEDGREKDAPLGVEISGLESYWPLNVLNDARPTVPVGQRMTLVFRQINSGGSDTARAARELRRTLSSYIDAASTYKLGSAKFRVAAPIKNVELEDGAMRVSMECIEAGICPREDYGTTDFKKNGREAQREIIQLQGEVKTLNDQLLRNEPILLPGVGLNVQNRLKDIQNLKDLLADLGDRKWTIAELNRLLNTGEIVDDRVREFAARVTQLRENRRGLRNQLEDELDKPRPERNRGNIASWRQQIQEINEKLRSAQTKLSKAFEQYGLADGIIPGRGKTLKQEKKWLNNRERELNFEISQITSNANNLDLAAMAARDASLRSQITTKQQRIDFLTRYLENPNSWNDFFNTKCLVKMEEAGYETITECRVVDFALKAKVFKRIQGRAPRYGEEKVKTFRDSDNGTKVRAAFFWLRYRRTGAEWSRLPYIFAVRRGADVDNFMSLKFIAGDNIGNWQFRFDPIAEPAAEMQFHGFANFAYIENSGDTQIIPGPAGGQFTFLGSIRARQGLKPPINVNPYEVDEWGLFSMRSDTQTSFSFEGGPEFSISAVTEQRIETFNNYPNLYRGLSLLGFNAYSGQGIQDLRSLSVFTLEGKKLRRLRDDGTYPAQPDGSSSYAPDIFLDTILDGENGIGQFAKIGGVDLQALALAKRFCRQNQLFMDGVIAEQVPWRQFWADVAPFSLLELGRVGGRETLVPAVPCDDAGNITRQVTISALFNQGNILEDSYREEFLDFGSSVQDLIASVIYRDTERDGVFPRNRSVEVSRADALEANSVRQTFDLSQYVTNRSQAILFGKLLCNQRRHIRRAIEFSTFPTDSVLEPGSYIYVAIGENQWDQVSTGVVEAGGVLNTPIGQVPNGSGLKALVYQSGSAVVAVDSVTVANGTASALARFVGRLFVLGTSITRKRVFRVTEVQMDEDGQVSVKAIEHPCVESGSQTLSLIASFADSGFTIR